MWYTTPTATNDAEHFAAPRTVDGMVTSRRGGEIPDVGLAVGRQSLLPTGLRLSDRADVGMRTGAGMGQEWGRNSAAQQRADTAHGGDGAGIGRGYEGYLWIRMGS